MNKNSVLDFQLLLSALFGLSMQSVIVPTLRSESLSDVVVQQQPQLIPGNWYTGFTPNGKFSIGTISRAAVEQQPQLVLTNPANWFSSLTPATGFTPPTFPPVLSFLTNNWNIQTPTAIPSSIVAPTITTADTVVSSRTLTPLAEEASVSETTTPPIISDEPITPALRLPVTTRKPGVPHHFEEEKDDNFIRYEIADGIHKITSNRQSFEIRYTNRNKGTQLKSEEDLPDIAIEQKVEKPENELKVETPADTPVPMPIEKTVNPDTPPLFHNSNNVEQLATVGFPFTTLNVLTLPQLPPQPFYQRDTIISRFLTLPFEERYAHTFV